MAAKSLEQLLHMLRKARRFVRVACQAPCLYGPMSPIQYPPEQKSTVIGNTSMGKLMEVSPLKIDYYFTKTVDNSFRTCYYEAARK